MLGSVIDWNGLADRERPEEAGWRACGRSPLIGLFGGILGADTGVRRLLAARWVLAGLVAAAAAARRRERAGPRQPECHHGGRDAAHLRALGVIAGAGQPILAIGAGVVAAVLLDLAHLHRWLRLIEQRELSAALQMLVLTAVILPTLPDSGYGPQRGAGIHIDCGGP